MEKIQVQIELKLYQRYGEIQVQDRIEIIPEIWRKYMYRIGYTSDMEKYKYRIGLKLYR